MLEIDVDASSEELAKAVQEMAEKGSTIKTGGWAGYSGLNSCWYNHVKLSNDSVKEMDIVY